MSSWAPGHPYSQHLQIPNHLSLFPLLIKEGLEVVIKDNHCRAESSADAAENRINPEHKRTS